MTGQDARGTLEYHPPASRQLEESVVYWRMAWKTAALFAVTFGSVTVPLLTRLLTGNSPRAVARLGSRATAFWARSVTRILGLRITASGRPRGETFIVASNHVSYLDIWVLASLYRCQFVAKQEIRGWPLFGWISRAAGTLFVDRETPRDAVRVIRKMRRFLDAGVSLTLFPEGGTSTGRSIRPFLPTLLEPAATARLPCYAAAVHYETPGEPDPPTETICWARGQNFATHLWRIMRMKRIEVQVSFSEHPLSSHSRKELARLLWEDAMRRHVPLRQRTA